MNEREPLDFSTQHTKGFPLSFSLSPRPFVIPSLMLAEKCVYASRPEVDSEDSSSGFNALQNWRQKLCTKLCVHA